MFGLFIAFFCFAVSAFCVYSGSTGSETGYPLSVLNFGIGLMNLFVWHKTH